MFFLKVVTFFLVVLTVGAEKKIELQDIEEDNLRSEMRTESEKELDKSDSPQTSDSGTEPGFNSLDFMKSGLLRYFENSQPQQQRYVHQYAVTEPPERNPPPVHKAQYGAPAAQQAMVGYLSNFPMQIYLVPQYYPEQSGQLNHPQPTAEYKSPGVSRVPTYQRTPEAVQTQTNYIEVPSSYMPPAGKAYIQQYTPPQPVTYITYPAQSTAPPPQATPAPVVAYQLPAFFQYNPTQVTSTNAPNAFYVNPEYADSNSLDELQVQDQKQYSSQTEVPFHMPTLSEFPRHYNSRVPIREDYRHHTVSELPHPNPLILKASPPHLSHIPKSLPMYRPLTKPVYQGGGLVSSFAAPPPEHYGPVSFKRRPTSLLDSYIPSRLQLEYVKRGLVKDPASAYEALVSGRLPHPIPRQHFERGFLPNQMYHTAAGGVTYGHYKRTPKVDKVQQK